MRHVLPKLFCGSSSYVTKCRRCRQESRHSSNLSEFFELDLQVKDMKSLDVSLRTLIAPDALEGNNQYFCDNCSMKTDADRMFCIRKVPPCLRLNLSRFNFDFSSGTKQKVRAAECRSLGVLC